MIATAPSIPSYGQGFARSHGERAASGLCRNMTAVWAPALGPGGETLFDWSPYGSHGVLQNMDPATDWVMSPRGWVLDFDGSDDYVDIGGSPYFDSLSYVEATMTAWYRSRNTSMADDEWIFGCGLGSNGGMSMIVYDDPGYVGEFGVFSRSQAGANQKAFSGVNVHDRAWHHLAAVRTRSDFILYVDGRQVAAVADNAAGQSKSFADGPYIGDSPGDTEQVNGQIGSVTFHTRALRAAEIRTLYEDPFALLRQRGRAAALSASTPTPSGGPYRVAAGEAFHTAAAAGESFVAGQTAGETFIPGPIAGQIHG